MSEYLLAGFDKWLTRDSNVNGLNVFTFEMVNIVGFSFQQALYIFDFALSVDLVQPNTQQTTND